ncbi:MAG: ECF-type sigma factor [Verrucomicrobiota bacterium]
MNAESDFPQSGRVPIRAAQFTTTHWTIVFSARRNDDPAAAAALEILCRTYWYPLYAYVRRQGRGAEESKDLTQAFFANLLRLDSLRNISCEHGRFRSFLLAAMNHFLADDWDHRHRQKRGGGVDVIYLDAVEAEERYRFEPVDRLDAARIFDRRWAMTVVGQALAQLEREFADRPAIFFELQPLLVGEGRDGTCADAAKRLGLSHDGVRATLSRMRKRCRQLVREIIAATVPSPSEVEEEYHTLLAALRS